MCDDLAAGFLLLFVQEGSPIEGFAGTGFEDPSLLQTSSFALVMSQQISLIRLTRIFVLQQGKDYLRQSVAPPA